MVGSGVITCDPASDLEGALGACLEDSTDLAVVIAIEHAIDGVGEAENGNGFFSGGVGDHEGEGDPFPGLDHAVGTGGLGDLDDRSDIGEVDGGIVIVGGIGAVVIFSDRSELVVVVGSGVITCDPFCEGELTGSASS